MLRTQAWLGVVVLLLTACAVSNKMTKDKLQSNGNSEKIDVRHDKRFTCTKERMTGSQIVEEVCRYDTEASDVSRTLTQEAVARAARASPPSVMPSKGGN